MVVDFGGETVAELDPRHQGVSVVGGSFDDVEVFQLFEDPDHRALGQPGAQVKKVTGSWPRALFSGLFP